MSEDLVSQLRNAALWLGKHAIAAADEIERLSARVAQAEELVGGIKRWAEQKCPCENDEPNPCPLCGASVENLEACKAFDGTLPPKIADSIRAFVSLTTP